MQKKASLSMAYLPEQLEMMLAEEKSKVSELERKLAIVTDLEQKYTGYWHDSETLRVAAENRLQQVQFAYYNLVSIHAKVCERVCEMESENEDYLENLGKATERVAQLEKELSDRCLEARGYAIELGQLADRMEKYHVAELQREESRQVLVPAKSGIDPAKDLPAPPTAQDYYVSKERTGVKLPNPIAQILDDELSTQVCSHGREMLNECIDCGRVPSATASNGVQSDE